MKGTGKIILGVSVGVMALLIYVHGQFLLFQTSYTMNHKAEMIREKGESYRQLKFEVDRLKAPRLLEARMAEREMDLTLPKKIRVVRIPEQPVLAPIEVTQTISQPLAGQFVDFLGKWVGIAQARTEQ